MSPSKFIAWICGDWCSINNEGSKPGPCLMCHAPHLKRKVVAASPATAAALAVASLPPAKPAHKMPANYPTHPSGLILNISGIAKGNWGCHCEEHKVCCGKVVEKDTVVHLLKERICRS